MRRFVLGGIVVLAACSSPSASGDDVDDDAGVIDAPVGLDAPPTSDLDPDWPAMEPIPAELDFPPWLNLLDATTVVVSWRTVATATGIVRFGTTPAYGDQVATAGPANVQHVMLSNLAPAAAYHYEVSIDGTSATRKGVFVMPGRSDFRVMHSGELHAPSEVTNVAKYATAIRTFRPHVIIESGDMVDDGNSLTHWRNYFRVTAPWISNVLLLPSHSNHVNGSGGNATLKELFVIPNNERWYATRYSQLAVLNIDSTYSANSDVASVEVPWIASESAALHDGTDDPTFVIASWHHPACSSQYFSRSGERNWVQTNLVTTLKNNGGVDLILAAHDKYYERSTITGGIVHVITNIGNISPEIPGGNHANCTAVKTDRNTQSVLFMTIAGSTLTGTVLDETGVQIDNFTIVK